MISTKIHITGIVQGVGFRAFVYRLAVIQRLTGWVRNTSAGVDIEVTGKPDEISSFINNIKSAPPPLSRIDSIEFHEIPVSLYDSFEIHQSIDTSNSFQPISPDICICDDCLTELFDPKNRRFQYPFINCTNCGPRLTIIEDIPYDRPFTTMKVFNMCPACKCEYDNPEDRRFHAQPIACPACGPHVWLEFSEKKGKAKNHLIVKDDEAIQIVQKMLVRGKIIAIKGLGGFHLACDATNCKAVAELRKRKLRVDKPFALMLPDIASIEEHCYISNIEQEMLESRERPIVILKRKESSSIAKDISPRQNTLGVMLPYTPLHYLLFSPIQKDGAKKRNKAIIMPPLVMTSGNISEEPIAIDNNEARERLAGLADAFLMHDRSIRTRCDDSVIRSFQGAVFPLRRSRGYAPYPVYLKSNSPQILAVGAELKNAFCFLRDQYAFFSHHIGDMENIETYDSFVDSITHYESLFRINPVAIAYDLHPNYLASRYAIERAQRETLQSFGVQHHHAHISSCMAENSIAPNRPVIGVAFDGTGYGDDGAIWGGEFFLADYQGYKRICHLAYVPLPGGDTAIRKPARVALAYLWINKLEWDPQYQPVSAICVEERSIIKSQLEHRINTPLTSSMGRLFDAVASIIGVKQIVNYEAQAAIELEALVDPYEHGEYNWSLEATGNHNSIEYQINPEPLINEILEDLQKNISKNTISARFHNSIARMVHKVCNALRKDLGIGEVVLSGGVWQNMTLLQHTFNLLSSDDFMVYFHRQVPTNDGGLALGQAIIAANRLQYGAK